MSSTKTTKTFYLCQKDVGLDFIFCHLSQYFNVMCSHTNVVFDMLTAVIIAQNIIYIYYDTDYSHEAIMVQPQHISEFRYCFSLYVGGLS